MNHKEIAIRVYQEIGAELNTEKMISNGWHKVDLGTIRRSYQQWKKNYYRQRIRHWKGICIFLVWGSVPCKCFYFWST